MIKLKVWKLNIVVDAIKTNQLKTLDGKTKKKVGDNRIAYHVISLTIKNTIRITKKLMQTKLVLMS